MSSGAHGRLPERAVGGVLKRTHHAGDIAQRGTLQFSFAQRPRRFAFEIENDEIFPGIERLAEMIIAVDPDLGRGRAADRGCAVPAREFVAPRPEPPPLRRGMLPADRAVSFATSANARRSEARMF